MSKVFSSNLEGFRRAATAGADRIYLSRNSRGGAQLSAQRVSVGGRLVQWLKNRISGASGDAASAQLNRQSREAHGQLIRVVEQNYGLEVANSVRGLVNRRVRNNRPLSSSVVRQTLRSAEQRSSQLRRVNWGSYRSFAGRKFSLGRGSAFKRVGERVLGGDAYARLSKSEVDLVNTYAKNKINSDKVLGQKKMDEGDHNRLLKESFTWLKEGRGSLSASEQEELLDLKGLGLENVGGGASRSFEQVAVRSKLAVLVMQANKSLGKFNEILGRHPGNAGEVKEWQGRAEGVQRELSGSLGKFNEMAEGREDMPKDSEGYRLATAATQGAERLRAAKVRLNNLQRSDGRLPSFGVASGGSRGGASVGGSRGGASVGGSRGGASVGGSRGGASVGRSSVGEAKDRASLWVSSAETRLKDYRVALKAMPASKRVKEASLNALDEAEKAVALERKAVKVRSGDGDVFIDRAQAGKMEARTKAGLLRSLGRLDGVLKKDKVFDGFLVVSRNSEDLNRSLSAERNILARERY